MMQHIHFTRPAKCQKNANKELYIAYMKSGHETKYSLLEAYSDRSRNKTTLNSVGVSISSLIPVVNARNNIHHELTLYQCMK